MRLSDSRVVDTEAMLASQRLKLDSLYNGKHKEMAMGAVKRREAIYKQLRTTRQGFR